MSQTEDPEESITRNITGDDITLPPHTRKKVLQRDNHQCSLCPAKSKKVGGDADLQVHHKEYQPAKGDVNDLDNLTTLCTVCHSWMHSQPEPEEFDIKITKQAIHNLVGGDFELLDILIEDGPMRAEQIAAQAAHNPDLATVKQRLYAIMGIDTIIDDQPQIIDKDAETGEWGLTEEIQTSARRDPETIYDTVQRTRDKIVQHAIENGIESKVIAKVVGIHRRQCYLFMHRGRALDFDINEYTGRGRPPKDGGGDVVADPANTGKDNNQSIDDTEPYDVDPDNCENTASHEDNTKSNEGGDSLHH